ncbi:MAG TPA: amidase [Candidatus Limnocylindrales bacterium]|nr:amidase [Candidatus Limnocylindrales bacterium]
MSELVHSSATALASAIARREVSSTELLDAYLQRIERLNPAYNIVVTLDADGARARAKAADEATARGESWGPLHGLPLTVKDTLETRGIRTTAGYPPLSDHVPTSNADVVESVVQAGAIVFGKTNAPVLAGDWQSYNPVFGVTRNPWNPERTPGGSSGGSAAAVVAGFTSFEIGSDIGGSIRVPSHWCGVLGHKPTHDIISQRGHIPGPPGALAGVDLAVMGPIARSADDLSLLLDVMARPSPQDARAWKLELPAPRHRRLSDFRIAAWLDDADYPVDPEVKAVLETAVQLLRKAGAQIDEKARPTVPLREIVDVYQQLLWPILLAGFPPEVFEEMSRLATTFPATAGDPVALMARYGTARHRDWLGANEVREHMRVAFADLFLRYDALLMPVNQVPAIPHDHSDPFIARTIQINGRTHPYTDLFAWIAPATAALLPATAVPAGRTTNGLPVGLQIVGPYLEDKTTIELARHVADVCGGFTPAPL